MSVTPISSRNARASILTVGCSCDEVGDRPRRDEHHADRDDDGGDHDADLVDHADRGEHRVEREHDVEQDDLDEDGADRRRPAAGLGRSWAGVALERLVDLGDAFQSRNRPPPIRIRSRHENSMPAIGEHRRGQPDDPRDREQQQDAHHHREAEADDPGAVALLRRQPLDEDRDEDDVVDAEHDLEHRQGQQGDPRLGVGQQVHASRVACAGPLRGATRARRAYESRRRAGRARLPVLRDRPPPALPSRAAPWAARSRRARRRACRRPSRRVRARPPEPAAVPPLDARLPDEPERFRGDGRAPARRPAARRRRRWRPPTSS